jgi:hypothetical protein
MLPSHKEQDKSSKKPLAVQRDDTEEIMRKLLPLLVVIATLFTSFKAAAQDPGEMANKPFSTGALIGFSAFEGDVAFALEIPLEYGIVVGPGNLILHIGFLLNAGDGTGIAIPMGVRYKIHITEYPLYVYPLFDIGPAFYTAGGDPFGYFRIGGGISYMVHPMVELIFQPLGLGAVFGGEQSSVNIFGYRRSVDMTAFVYNFEVGAQLHF